MAELRRGFYDSGVDNATLPELDLWHEEDEEIEQAMVELWARWSEARHGGQHAQARWSSRWRERYRCYCYTKRVRVEWAGWRGAHAAQLGWCVGLSAINRCQVVHDAWRWSATDTVDGGHQACHLHMTTWLCPSLAPNLAWISEKCNWQTCRAMWGLQLCQYELELVQPALPVTMPQSEVHRNCNAVWT
jgi:hypothetical protein